MNGTVVLTRTTGRRKGSDVRFLKVHIAYIKSN